LGLFPPLSGEVKIFRDFFSENLLVSGKGCTFAP